MKFPFYTLNACKIFTSSKICFLSLKAVTYQQKENQRRKNVYDRKSHNVPSVTHTTRIRVKRCRASGKVSSAGRRRVIIPWENGTERWWSSANIQMVRVIYNSNRHLTRCIRAVWTRVDSVTEYIKFIRGIINILQKDASGIVGKL